MRSKPDIVQAVRRGLCGVPHQGSTVLCRLLQSGLLVSMVALCGAASVAGQEAPQKRHSIGFSPRLVVLGKTVGAPESIMYADYSPSEGFALKYAFRATQSIAVGGRVERWFLRKPHGAWYASAERYCVVLEWTWLRRGLWELTGNGGVGLSALWTREYDAHYVGIGPGLDAAIGVRRWFGHLALFADVGSQLDLGWGVGPMTDARDAESVSMLLWVGLGVEVRL